MSSHSVVVAVGEEFEIRLQGNPSAGYVWEPDSLPEGIELSGSESVPPGQDSRPGAPGTQVFRFRAHETGDQRLGFVLKRSWESEVADRHEVTVQTS
jgi:predicted secreted protein